VCPLLPCPLSVITTPCSCTGLDLNRGHDKSLSFNLDQKTGEWKAEFVRYRYKRDTELVVGCAGYASLFTPPCLVWPCLVACLSFALVDVGAVLLPCLSVAVCDCACSWHVRDGHSPYVRTDCAGVACVRVRVRGPVFIHAGDIKSSSRQKRGGMRNYGAARAATAPSRARR
jgi:hypothetical protein